MSYNLRIPEMGSDDDGSTLGIDMLMNNKKKFAENVSDGDDSYPGIQVGKMDDSSTDIEILSEKMDNNINTNNANFRRAFSEASDDDDWKPKPQYNSQDILNMKRELLYQFDRLEKKGVKIPRKFTLSSSLEEMKTEYERLKRDREVDAGIRFQRRMLMASVTGIEFLNERFDPFDFKLSGWSESIHENISDYDDVFEELYDKWKGSAKLAPELRLLFMVGGSAVWFHISNSMFKTMPGIDQVFKQNPDLRRQFAEATMNTMAQNANGPIPGMGGASQGGLAGLMGLFSGGQTGGVSTSGAPQQPRPHMKGPSDVDDLLNELRRETLSNNDVEVISVTTGEQLSELADDASIGGLLSDKPLKKKKVSKRRTLNL